MASWRIVVQKAERYLFPGLLSQKCSASKLVANLQSTPPRTRMMPVKISPNLVNGGTCVRLTTPHGSKTQRRACSSLDWAWCLPGSLNRLILARADTPPRTPPAEGRRHTVEEEVSSQLNRKSELVTDNRSSVKQPRCQCSAVPETVETAVCPSITMVNVCQEPLC